MKVLNTNEKMTPEKRQMIENLGKKAFNLSSSKIIRIIDDVSPDETFIKKQWYPMVKRFWTLLRMEYGSPVSVGMVYNEIRCEMCLFIEKNREKLNKTPERDLPKIVYWKLSKESGKRLRKAYEDKMKLSFTDDVDEFQSRAKINFTEIRPHSMFVGGQWYMLIEGIAEKTGLSSQTLRNWEQKGDIVFVHLKDVPTFIKRPFTRGVLSDDVPDFIKKIEELKNPPVGFLNTRDTLKKLGIHHTTLKRRRKVRKIPFIKWKNKYFYKV